MAMQFAYLLECNSSRMQLDGKPKGNTGMFSVKTLLFMMAYESGGGS